MDQAQYTPAPADAVLRFQQERIIKVLFTEFLMVLEDLARDHDIALDKLSKALPPDLGKYIDLADYFTPEKGDVLRKRVLDRGNHALRELHAQVDHFNVEFK